MCITSQTTQAPKLINKNKEDENTTTAEPLSVHIFSNHRPPIKISIVQNEEQDEVNVQLKFHNDPTVNEPNKAQCRSSPRPLLGAWPCHTPNGQRTKNNNLTQRPSVYIRKSHAATMTLNPPKTG
ncbi:hypothetical protein PIB30_034133 [Stylosanthes scabra]|uniref:Uncharacterized protein n=1 Tax=Stylosanthes scabra TaxID=79078 RepID=A0ABU6UE12_9FABA|nr:hypothetical protein [Stylosanthes scabra]